MIICYEYSDVPVILRYFLSLRKTSVYRDKPAIFIIFFLTVIRKVHENEIRKTIFALNKSSVYRSGLETTRYILITFGFTV